MKSNSYRSSTLITLLCLFLSFVFLIAFAPKQLGGPVTYVIINGNSMEPNFHLGDLILVRMEPVYRVGDAVTYENAEMGAFVFHRIVGTELNRFILKGDNNSWLDSYQPGQDEIIGKLWLYIPKLGRAIEWVRAPLRISLVVALLGGVLMIDMIAKPTEIRKKKNKHSFNFDRKPEGVLYLTGFFVLIFLALGGLSFTRSLNRPAENATYQQEGNFFYSATGTPGVYDSDLVRSGEPVFPKLTCFLNVGFNYNLVGSGIQGVTSLHSMVARIMDEESGWFRTISLNPETSFNGNSYSTVATLDLCQVESLVNLVEQEAGLNSNTYTLEIVSNVVLNAVGAGDQFSDTFEPRMVFKYDKVHFYLVTQPSQQDPLRSIKPGIVSGTSTRTNTIPILGLNPPVWLVRFISLLGFGFSLFGLVAIGMKVYSATSESQEALIRLKYGSVLVDVHQQSLNPSLPVIDVATIDDLARLAERQGTMILHMTLNFLQYYLVQSNVATYRYVISTGKKGIPDDRQINDQVLAYTAAPLEVETAEFEFGLESEPKPDPEPHRVEPNLPKIFEDEQKIIDQALLAKEIPEPIVIDTENKTMEPKPAPEQRTDYVINRGEIAFTLTYQETAMLRKIKL